METLTVARWTMIELRSPAMVWTNVAEGSFLKDQAPALELSAATVALMSVRLLPTRSVMSLETPEQSGGALSDSNSEGLHLGTPWLKELARSADVPVPGAPSMTVRLVPTKEEPAADAAPLVFRPRVRGVGSSWYGLDFAASF